MAIKEPRFVHVGFGNIVRGDSILAIVSPNASCAKRHVKRAKAEDAYIDLCLGHTLRSVLITNDGTVLGCGIGPRTLQQRLNGTEGIIEADIKEDHCL